MQDYGKDLKWGEEQDEIVHLMSIKQSVFTVIGPIIFQIVLILFISAIDPCNNNPGCMAGSITAYAVLLVLPSSFVILSLISYFEYITGKVSFYNSLTINCVLAALPFVLVLILMFKVP